MRLWFHEETTSLGCYLGGYFFFFLEDLDIFVCILVTDCCVIHIPFLNLFFLKGKTILLIQTCNISKDTNS